VIAPATPLQVEVGDTFSEGIPVRRLLCQLRLGQPVLRFTGSVKQPVETPDFLEKN